MKKVEAIINPSRLDAVKQALASVGIDGLTMSEVKGIGHEKGPVSSYRGGTFVPDTLPKIKLEALIEDFKVAQVVDAIQRAARSGRAGDGKVFVIPVDEVAYSNGRARQ